MGNTLGEIDAGLKVFNNVLPTAFGIAATFDPALAPILTPVQLVLAAIGKEIDVASQDTSAGKSFQDIISDIISGLPSQQAGTAPTASN